MAQYDAKKDIEFLKAHGVTSERDQISWLRDNRGVKLNSRSLSELASGARTYDSVTQVSGGNRQQQGSFQQTQSDEDGKKSYMTDRLRQDVDKSGAIRQSSTMTLVGNVGVGRGHVNISRYQTGDGAAFIYDEVTGNLYKTNTWSDVSRNEKGWVDGSGRRFKGWVHQEAENAWSVKSEKEIKYEVRKKGGYGMYAAFGDEKTPAAGTEAFNKWALSEYISSQEQEALSHRYDPSKGKLNTGTDYKQFGTISVKDWVALGMPSSFGGLTILDSYLEPYRGKSADQVLAMTGGGQGLLVGQDRKKRHSGFAKVVGGVFGHSAADKFAKVTNVGAAVLAMVPIPITWAIAAGLRYAAAEDQSFGSQRLALRHTAQGLTTDAVNFAILVAAAAATVFSAGTLAPYTGALVASVAAGAVTGAAAGAATTAADASIARVYTGEHDTHRMYNDMGKAAVRGGVTGAVSAATGATLNGAVNPFSASYGDASWVSRLSGLARVGINATTQGVLAYQQGGSDKGLSAALAAANAVVGDVRSSGDTARMPSHAIEAAALQERADAGRWGALGAKSYLGTSNDQIGSAPAPAEWAAHWDMVGLKPGDDVAKANGKAWYRLDDSGRRVTDTNLTVGDVLYLREMGFGGGMNALRAAYGGNRVVQGSEKLRAEMASRVGDARWWNTYKENGGKVSIGDVYKGLGLQATVGYTKLDAGTFFGLLPGGARPTVNIWSGDRDAGVTGLNTKIARRVDGLTFGLFDLTGSRARVENAVIRGPNGTPMTAEALVEQAARTPDSVLAAMGAAPDAANGGEGAPAVRRRSRKKNNGSRGRRRSG